MVQISQAVTSYVAAKLAGDSGVNFLLSELRKTDSHTPCAVRSFLCRNAAAEALERANQAHYPAVLVYCEKVSNLLKEKFRTFSGTARVTVEIRDSDDRVEMLDRSCLIYADTVCAVMMSIRGTWADGIMYTGGYEVSYSAVKTGGKHFLQSTKITFEVDVSE